MNEQTPPSPSGADQVGEIREGNRLIALFDGLEVIPKRHYNEMNPALEYYGHMDKYGTVTNLQSEMDLKYHLSYDAIMPIVDTINKQAKFMVNGKHCYFANANIFIEGDWKDTRLGCLWTSVVAYIKHHNAQTPSSHPQ